MIKGELAQIKRRIEEAGKIGSLLERQLLVAGLISRALEPRGIEPIVVGGCAAEFYTLGLPARSTGGHLETRAGEEPALLEALRSWKTDMRQGF